MAKIPNIQCSPQLDAKIMIKYRDINLKLRSNCMLPQVYVTLKELQELGEEELYNQLANTYYIKKQYQKVV